MNGFGIILSAIIGLAISWLAIPMIQRYLRPSTRRQLHHTHQAPISRFGGLALAIAFTVLALVAWLMDPEPQGGSREHWLIALASLAMFTLGFIDDVRPLGAKRKLCGQVLIASAVYFGGIHIGQIQNPITGTNYILGAGGYLATVFWLVAFTNLINLIDGMDGVAGGICLLAMSLLVFVSYQSGFLFSIVCTAGMCGALIGFLCFNFPPAKIYLGDGGAYFLGFLIGILSMVHSHKGTVAAALLAPLFVLALPIIDVSLAIFRRGLKGLPLFRPDRRHLHHRLAEAGLSRTRIVWGFYSCTLVFLLLGLGVFISRGKWLPVLFGVGCAVLLISARSFSFSREWFSVGKMLGNSLDTRKQIRYAFSLSRWLELEAERSQSAEELWADFAFLSKKLGFTAVSITTPECRKQWRWVPSPRSAKGKQHPSSCRVRDVSEDCSLEFTTPDSPLDNRTMDLLSELAAEGWIKAARRWELVHGAPLCFKQSVPVEADPRRMVPFNLASVEEPGPA